MEINKFKIVDLGGNKMQKEASQNANPFSYLLLSTLETVSSYAAAADVLRMAFEQLQPPPKDKTRKLFSFGRMRPPRVYNLRGHR